MHATAEINHATALCKEGTGAGSGHPLHRGWMTANGINQPSAMRVTKVGRGPIVLHPLAPRNDLNGLDTTLAAPRPAPIGMSCQSNREVTGT